MTRRKDDLDATIAELYRRPREDFVAGRDDLAKRLRREDKRAEADRVKALRKPTAAAWIVNQLNHDAKGDLKKLLAVGARMRRARTAKAMREAAAQEREAIAALLGRVDRIAAEPTAATLERVRETLHAAAVDEGVGEAVAAGRLTAEQRFVGFGSAGPLRPDRAGGRGATSTDAATERRRRREHEAAQRRLERAQAAHERARREAEVAQRELERAEAELQEATEEEHAAAAGRR